jgi:hypothetical protein
MDPISFITRGEEPMRVLKVGGFVVAIVIAYLAGQVGGGWLGKQVSAATRPAPAPPTLSPFQCYPISGNRTGKSVDLKDQFREVRNVAVETPQLLCVPVTGIRISPAPTPTRGLKLDHLKCYNIRQRTAPDKVVRLDNQFGTEEKVTLSKPPTLLCMPTAKKVGQ